MAHGLAGVVAFLAAVHDAGCQRERTGRLLDGAVAFLLAHRQSSALGVFPRSVRYGEPSAEIDVSWCWGDTGTASALLAAAHARSTADWARIATLTARQVAHRLERPGESPADASLCHGRAGLAHMFACMAHETGDPVLRLAAVRWMEQTLHLQTTGDGVGGFQFCFVDKTTHDTTLRSAAGYLIGSAGVAATLAASCSWIAPSWDFPFLFRA